MADPTPVVFMISPLQGGNVATYFGCEPLKEGDRIMPLGGAYGHRRWRVMVIATIENRPEAWLAPDDEERV